MSHQVWNLHDLQRREFILQAAKSCLGVSLGAVALSNASLAAENKTVTGSASVAKAKHVIYLRMRGAMSHVDTFDPKPGNEVKPIATKTPGIQIGQYLPELAKLSNHLAIVRSISTTTADHASATYLLTTNYREIASIRHPAMGSMANRLLGLRKKTLPDYVVVGDVNRHPGAGYLDTSYSPIPINDPNLGLQNTTRPKYLNDSQFNERLQLMQKLSSSFRRKYPQKQVDAFGEFYRQAVELMSSEDLKAFDLNQEKETVRSTYGDSQFGQGALLARRLVEHDVRWVEVSFGNWDMHNNIYDDDELPKRASELDRVMSALLRDLDSRGLLKTTAVVLATEFGRTPKMNDRNGRDHHPGVFSCVLAGAGVKGGQVYGASDKVGFRAETNGIDIADFNATVGTIMGLKLDQEVVSKSGRPFKFANEGKAVPGLIA
jgi:hypothetical protein